MTKILTSTWMTALLSALIYLGATVAFWKTPKHIADVAVEDSGPLEIRNGPSWDFINPEAELLMAELKTEKKSLAKKEQELNDLSARLVSERGEMNQVTQSVRKLQADFDENVLRIKEEETANLKKLAKVYAGMAPESAASIFAELDDTSVVKIMVYMKDAETAAVFESLAKKGQPDAKRAAALSERLRLAAFRPPPTK